MILKNQYGDKIGAFIPQQLKKSREYYGTGETFVFRFTPSFEFFGWNKDSNQYFISSSSQEISIGGGGSSAIWIDGDLLNASKRTVQATKLSEDELVAVIVADWSEESEDKVVLQTKDGVFLKFPYAEIPKKKKSALGVRGMKLSKDDLITNVYVMDAQNISSIMYKEKELEFNRLKLSKRDTKGTKVRR